MNRYAIILFILGAFVMVDLGAVSLTVKRLPNLEVEGTASTDTLHVTNNATLNGVPFPKFPIAHTLLTQGFIITNIHTYNLTPGTNDLYTIPAGYTGYVVGPSTRTTNFSSLGTFQYFLKTNAVYHPIHIANAGSTNTASSFVLGSTEAVFQAGEAIAIATTTQGYDSRLGIVLIPTSIYPGVKTYWNWNILSGDTVLYTVPTNTIAFGMTEFVTGNLGNVSGTVMNFATNSMLIKWYVVPSGFVEDTSTLVSASSITTNTGSNTSGFGLPALYPGDSIIVNVDTTNDYKAGFVTVLEIPQ